MPVLNFATPPNFVVGVVVDHPLINVIPIGWVGHAVNQPISIRHLHGENATNPMVHPSVARVQQRQLAPKFFALGDMLGT